MQGARDRQAEIEERQQNAQHSLIASNEQAAAEASAREERAAQQLQSVIDEISRRQFRFVRAFCYARLWLARPMGCCLAVSFSTCHCSNSNPFPSRPFPYLQCCFYSFPPSPSRCRQPQQPVQCVAERSACLQCYRDGNAASPTCVEAVKAFEKCGKAVAGDFVKLN